MAKKAKPRPPRPKKAKQAFLDGMEPVTIKEIDDAAELFFDAIRERLPYTEAETEAKKSLIAVMEKHEKAVYKTSEGKMVNLSDTKNVTVKLVKEKKGEHADIDEAE